ncbi:MAG: hypothetical protein JXO51_02210, partial [Candidatus Aminicenantes bacterium]|nr:hypothetical protein [Candidatus Aminicenantes bacterium]
GPMHQIMTRGGGFAALLLLALCLPSQEAAKASMPERVRNSLDGLQKTRTANGVFDIRYLNSFFWALEKSVYVNVLFRADLDADVAVIKEGIKKKYDEKVAAEMKKLEETNRKIKKEEDKKKWQAPPLEYPEHFHDLYMRVLRGGQSLQEYRSHVPCSGDAAEYYSFGTVLEPGEYEILININRCDNTLDGTQRFTVSVPELRLSDIVAPRRELATSKPVFYTELKQLLEPESRFTVVKNKYQIGPAAQDFYPWGDRPFRGTDRPILTFFILGAAMVQGAEPWDISAVLEIRGTDKAVAKFEPVKLGNPYFYQPIEFGKKENGKGVPLPAGDYELLIGLTDNNQGGKVTGTVRIPLRIVE